MKNPFKKFSKKEKNSAESSKIPAKPSKKTKKRKKLLIVLVVLIVIAAIAIFAFFFFSRRNRTRPNMDISFTTETATIERQTLTNSISATGTVESAETKTVNTRMTNMEVLSVYVKEGDYVEEGTVICEFDSSDYAEELAKAKNNQTVNAQIDALNGTAQTIYDEALAEAEEGLEEVRAARDEAKDAYTDAEETLEKKKEKLDTKQKAFEKIADKYEAAKRTYEQLQQQPSADTKQLKEAKAEYEKYKKKYDAYMNAQEAYKSAEQAAEQAEAAYEQAQSQREQYQDTYEEAIERAQDTYERAVLEEQLISESQEEKTINEYTELIEDCVVKANMSGVITSLNVTEGNNFEGGDIYTIQDNGNFIVSSTVDEYDISSIEKGMTAYIKTDATGDVEMTGEVTYVAIAPASTGGQMGAISSSASYRIEVTIHDPAENLRAGMTAKISIALEESEDALTVPYDAVTIGRDGNSTITVDVNGEKKTISVKTGLETDYYTEVICDEISEGMTVYLTTPLTFSSPDGSEEMGFPGGMNAIPGGDMPSGGFPGGNGGGRGGFSGGNGGGRGGFSGGGMPSGGGPGGF